MKMEYKIYTLIIHKITCKNHTNHRQKNMYVLAKTWAADTKLNGLFKSAVDFE